MICTLCGSSQVETILSKRAIPIFINSNDESKMDFGKHRCVLEQCSSCGHVFQPVSAELSKALENIYDSEFAQITTSPGVGNWGAERAKFLLGKLKRIESFKTKSILELGCGNSYILRSLRKLGFENLVGIDPSINRTKQIDGILLLSEFISKELALERKFDLIFSFGVYEHIGDIDAITSFCTNHLNDDGLLFIYVPNSKKGLTVGDPAIFAHEHMQYFVPNSIKYHLSRHGYQIIDSESDDHAIVVYAKRNEDKYHEAYIKRPYNKFQDEVEEKLEMIKNILCSENVIIHGACNSLNNILGWLDGDFDYTLVDNDNTKHGKTFFNKKVEFISDIDVIEYDSVVIIPSDFSDAIKSGYLKKGFRGKFLTMS